MPRRCWRYITEVPTSQEREFRQEDDWAGHIVAYLRLRHRRTSLVGIVVLSVLVGVCVLAVLTRLSALPLVPLVSFGVAACALWGVRTAVQDRVLLHWWIVFAISTIVGFWLISFIRSFLGA